MCENAATVPHICMKTMEFCSQERLFLSGGVPIYTPEKMPWWAGY